MLRGSGALGGVSYAGERNRSVYVWLHAAGL